eukprot:CAMPEP_0196664354 /NCGR_PEP_ID=MMETSP1086-20130531/56845_1 /TAXON_ID=77921 /ORGANISM="Cyanoptyche  gloeocystis , Strain SAG4.97" /LENGTH=146 /DNA_ID=CAMNT_0042000625 /DNA_START=63 /DNA_END=500 /DNA_ORIENTATION=-
MAAKQGAGAIPAAATTYSSVDANGEIQVSVPGKPSVPDLDVGSGHRATLDATHLRLHEIEIEHNRRKAKGAWKTTAAAVLLLCIGVSFIIAGFVTLRTEGANTNACFILGAITILPGSYYTVRIIKSRHEKKDMDYGDMPDYDEQV